MVLFFSSDAVSPSAVIRVGRDKYENEELITHGWENDVWFHVDNLSSAHVYLRMPDNMTWDSIPEALLRDLGQLTKAKSIQGNRKDNLTVIYTPWKNLKKTGSMETGQVGFYNPKMVRKLLVECRINEVVNRLAKTKLDRPDLDLQAEKAEMLKNKRRDERHALERVREEENARIKAVREDKLRAEQSYQAMFSSEALAANSNQNRQEGYDSDEFM